VGRAVVLVEVDGAAGEAVKEAEGAGGGEAEAGGDVAGGGLPPLAEEEHEKAGSLGFC